MATRRLTENEWIDEFKPEEYPNGDLFVQRDPHDPEDWELIRTADKERRLWTMVDDDEGYPMIAQGFHIVNRLYHVIATVPYALDDDITVLSDID